MKLRHFDPRVGQARRKFAHCRLLAMGEERTTRFSVAMPP
jgi:hypothetical protein